MKHAVLHALLVLAVSTVSALEPWSQLGPFGASVGAMAGVTSVPDDVYFVPAGYPARVFYSSNTGRTWSVLDSIPDCINCVVVDPDDVFTLLAGGTSGRVWRSINGGRNWNVYGSLAGSPVIRQLAFKPGQSLVVWAAADFPATGGNTGLGIFTSTNGGSIWDGTYVDSGHTVNPVLLDPGLAQGDRLYLGGSVDNQARLFRSADGGGNWDDISAGLGGRIAWQVAVSPTDSQVLVCATDAGLYRSTSNGSSWTRALAVPCWSARFASLSPYYCYAGAEDLTFRSTNNGATWSTDSAAGIEGSICRWLAFNENSALELYAGNGAGVWHTTNGGFDWTHRTATQRSLTVRFLYPDPHDPAIIHACPPGRGVLRSADGGNNWTREYRRLPNSSLVTGIGINPRDPDTLGVVTSFDASFHLTTDRGDSWVSYPITANFEARGIGYHPRGPDTLFAWGGIRDSAAGRTRFAIYRSTSQGTSWSRLFDRSGPGACLGFDITATGDTAWAWGFANNAPAVFQSTDRGRSWTGRTSGLSGYPVADFKRSPADPEDVWYVATPAGVYRTLGAGDFWTRLGTITKATAVLPDTADNDIVFAGTDTQGVYYTTNAGAIWDRDTLGLAGRTVVLLQRQPGNPAGMFCGIEGASLAGRGVIGILEPRPPVPGAGRTVASPTLIRDRLMVRLGPSSSGRATLDLYYPDGRLCRRLATLDPAPPTWTWHRPPDLVAGLYLLVVNAGTDTRTAKLILAR